MVVREHKHELPEGQFWACHRPEQLVENGIWWDETCLGCRLAYHGAQINDPYAVVYTNDGRKVFVTDIEIGSDEWSRLAP